MHHWISMSEQQPAMIAKLVDEALRFKGGQAGTLADPIRDAILTMVFFNPSLRTRTSFEAAMLRYGGHSICLNVGSDSWKLEDRDGIVMNGDCAEHIREAAPVLSRYGDLIAIRTFAKLRDPAEDVEDRTIRAFERYATVPVINMESAMEHPCQGLGDWMTMAEKLGETRKKRFVLTWAPHVKALPMAVANSAVLSAAAAGMNVTIAHPSGYELDAAILQCAECWCAEAGTELSLTDDQVAACRSADVVYVKSWGSTALYRDSEAQKADFRKYADWTVGTRHLADHAILMHCLPVRRNLVISDQALDDPRSVVVDQAENRMWCQAAIISHLLRG